MTTVLADPFEQLRRLSTALACCAWLVAGAQPAPAPTASHAAVVADVPALLSDVDQRFVVAAAGALHYQREAARLALQRSADPLVRAHAVLLIRQHGQACQELHQMVQARKLPWPEGVPADRRGWLDALAALPAETFDRRFVDLVGFAHQQADLEMFAVASHMVNDPALRAWARRMLPVVRRQLVSAWSLPARTAALS